MTDLSVNPVQTDILVASLLETLFNAKLHHTQDGQIPVTADKKPLEEFGFGSTWITYNKLIKDIQEKIGRQFWPITNPHIGCEIHIRPIHTEVIDGDRKFTHFNYAIDPLGFEPNASEVSPLTHKKIFSPEDVVVGMIESTGIHTRMVPENEIPKDRNGKELRVLEVAFSWYGITELQTQASHYIFGLANAYEQTATIHFLKLETEYHDQPKRNVTNLKLAIEHPEF